RLGFYGLGTMGTHMAGHLHGLAASSGGRAAVASRDGAKAEAWAAARGADVRGSFAELAEACDVVCLCLSTTDAVEETLLGCGDALRDTLVVDCTSGEPARTAALGARLRERGARLVDSPVSGGPAGAEAGTLTSMMGGSDADVADARAVVGCWSKKTVHRGALGSGDAVKSVNNVLNTAHVLLATEAALVLQKYGVDAATALDVINSRARARASLEVPTRRLPERALSRDFGFGFKMGLMRKDCAIADALVADLAPTHALIPEATRLIRAAEARLGSDADYAAVARLLEAL
ncbi:hypothetical protein AURANDRAFT_13554, partial [Aureococcus anophagefferens]